MEAIMADLFATDIFELHAARAKLAPLIEKAGRYCERHSWPHHHAENEIYGFPLGDSQPNRGLVP